jgi:serine/threonine-protein kinase
MKVGERIGDYEIVEVLGNGGMGQVYKVRNLLSERVEAMKVLLPNLAGDPELAERFLREIKLQASLDHPNIAKLHTAFRESNQLLMVMEYVEGLSIEMLLAHGPLLTHDAVSYAAQVLSALGYAHARGVVHRDIKPANLMRTPSGAIKLLDFGIAHLQKADNKLTKTGTTLGSLYYIAPELIKGSQPDAACDIYSLGVVLYEMVTGNKPFQGDSQYSIMTAHMQGTPVPPIEAVPWVPKLLNDAILKAMAKDPADRFHSAEAFSGALDNAPVAEEAATQVMAAAPTQVMPATQVLPQTKPIEPAPAIPPPSGTQLMPIAPPSPAAHSTPAAMSAPQRNRSHRGLYVALGSCLTLLVLAAAAIGAPGFFGTRADSSGKKHTRSAHSAATEPTPSQATTSDDQTAVIPPSSRSTASPSSSSDTSSPSSTTATANQPSPPGPSDPVEPPTTGTHSAPAKPASERTPSPSNGPTAQAQESYLAQMRELQEETEQLDLRVQTASASLKSLKDQMASQGLGMRSDVLAAETRMNHFLNLAEKELARGDAVSAEHDLKMAGYAVDFIEKFLGR